MQGGGACKGHTEIPFFLLLFHLFCILVTTKKVVANEGIIWYLLRSFPNTVTAPIWYHTNIYCPLQNHIRCSSYASFQRSPKHNTVRNNPCPLGCRDYCRFSEKCLATVWEIMQLSDCFSLSFLRVVPCEGLILLETRHSYSVIVLWLFLSV